MQHFAKGLGKTLAEAVRLTRSLRRAVLLTD
jgi:hypothetical protein